MPTDARTAIVLLLWRHSLKAPELINLLPEYDEHSVRDALWILHREEMVFLSRQRFVYLRN